MEKRHSIRKRLLIIFICIVFVCGVFAGVGTLARRAHAVTVKVIPVSDLNQAFSEMAVILCYMGKYPPA